MKYAVLILVLFCGMSSFGADPEPYLKSAPMLFYPGIARTARIEGTVSLQATVNEQGDTSDVVAISGHPLLKEASIQNVKNWKFGWGSPCACKVTRQVTFVYKLSGRQETPKSATAIVKWFGMTRVEIEADNVPINVQTSY